MASSSQGGLIVVIIIGLREEGRKTAYRSGKIVVEKETLQAMSVQGSLGPGDDFVWTRGQSKADAGLVVGLDCGGDIECGDLDIFRPMTALPIISAGINGAAYDGVFGHLLP